MTILRDLGEFQLNENIDGVQTNSDKLGFLVKLEF